MKNNYTVYMHISPNNKRYIGITQKRPEYRWLSDGSGYKRNNHFWNAINKYGWDNFQHIIIAKGLSEDEAKWLEMELIRLWDTTNQDKGYNILSGGQTMKGENNPMFGKQHSEEAKEKMSENHRDCSGENNPMFGKQHSEEAKEKMSEANKGRIVTEETRKKLSNANKGENNPMFGVHKIGKDSSNKKSIICITTKRIFYTIKEGAFFYNCDNSSIAKCCKKKKGYKTCGKLANGTRLVWKYLIWEHNKIYRKI